MMLVKRYNNTCQQKSTWMLLTFMDFFAGYTIFRDLNCLCIYSCEGVETDQSDHAMVMSLEYLWSVSLLSNLVCGSDRLHGRLGFV